MPGKYRDKGPLIKENDRKMLGEYRDKKPWFKENGRETIGIKAL